MTPQEFFAGPYAALAGSIEAGTGISALVLTAQASDESANGTSRLAVEDHNYSGVTYVGQEGAEDAGGFAKYADDTAYVRDMIRILSLTLYQAVREAVGVREQVYALAASPWAGSHYGGGQNLIGILQSVEKWPAPGAAVDQAAVDAVKAAAQGLTEAVAAL